ncbi:MAG: carboxypeptidase regulatory-like domain-containing protein [Candidatus Solibacter usitatus]|nr:carboxypeptidase regulatory-like domain-containing protein [Candidatus Solibacter usitatus]
MKCAVSAVLFAALHFPVWAQNPTAQVTGLVQDSTGAVVPNARVEVINAGTGSRWQLTTNESGYYTAPLLPPGDYRVAAHAQGFKSVNRSGVTLVVAQVARIDFTLEVGGVAETVEVSATAPLLESQSASLGQIVETKVISDLPLNGRNYLQLAKLAAGVVEPRRGDVGALGGSFVANGVRAQLNNYNLDGADNNTRIVDIQNRSHEVVQPSVDAVQEFKIETNTYAAEYGYSAGAVVNATIKSGTNRYHGSTFEFVRNNHFDARNFFQRPADPQAILQRNQFGGVVGGPVVHDKLFFFGSWERTIENRGLTLTTTVPAAALRRGDFGAARPIFDPATTRANPAGAGFVRAQFPGNLIPASRIDPVSAKLTDVIPEPNRPGSSNNFVSNPAQTDRVHRADNRGDWNISDRDKAFLRYSYLTRQFLNPGVFPPPLIGATTNDQHRKTTRAHSAVISETHVFSSSLVNEFRSGYSRVYDLRGDIVDGPFLGPRFGFKGIPANPGNGISGLPGVSISGYTNLGETSFVPNGKIAEVMQFKDDISWLRGSHSFKAGGQFQWVRSYFDISNSARGTFSFSQVFTQNPQNRPPTGDAFADFALGVPASSSISRTNIGDVRQKYVSFFLQDDWKATTRLTLNLGVRYEIWTPRFERTGLQANFLPGTGKFIFPGNNVPPSIPASIAARIPDGAGNRTLVKTDRNNLAPRLGIAYQLTRRTVLRAGGGIFYASPAFPGVGATLPGNPPFSITSTYPTDQITPSVTFASGFPSDALDVRSIDPVTAAWKGFEVNFPVAYVSKWSFGLQQEIGQFLFEANYVGTRGSHYYVHYDVNQPGPGGGTVQSRRPFPALGGVAFTTPAGFSNYQSLQTRLERRYRNGFALLTSYSYSKATDAGGEQLGGGDLQYRDTRNIFAERGLAGFDMRHRFVGSFLYDLPFGRGKRFGISNPILSLIAGNWQVNGIFTVRGGQPFTPSLGFSTANTGDPRPDRLRDGNLPSNARSVGNWFDKTAFAAATPFNFGNAGRNILIGPGGVNFDCSVFKRVPVKRLGEGGEVQFRVEAFNAVNHTQFDIPNSRVDIPQGATITALATPMREMQLGLKVIF